MKREAGFYWVRTKTGWTVAEFSPFYDDDRDLGSWYICGNETAYNTDELQAIKDVPLIPPGTIPPRTSVISIALQLEKENSETLRSVIKSFFKKRSNGR